MNPNLLLLFCALIWGCTTFMQKLSADKMSPILMQIIIGTVFFIFTPIAIWFQGGLSNLKWNTTSITLSFVAAAMSIVANILLYSALSNNKNTGSSAMMISLYPVVTLILSAIFLGEQFSFSKICGVSAMIIGALILSFC
jgi:transporter family protein